MDSNKITDNLVASETLIKNTIGESFDTKYRHFAIPAFNNSETFIVYISGLTDTRVIDETILEPLIAYAELPKNKLYLKIPSNIQILMQSSIFTSAVIETNLFKDVFEAIMEGDTALFVDKCDTALILTTRKYESRSITEPITENEIRGPKDGFIENIQTNTSLIRRRIREYSLRFESMKIGERTKTTICLAYMGSLVNEDLLNEVRTRVSRIKIDAVLGSSYIEEFIEDSPYSIFPQIANTERPDKACAAILDGRIVILVDNTSFALIVPTVFWQFFLSSGDYYERYFIGTFLRWIRAIAMFISTSMSSIYVLTTSFHQEMLPTALALKISATRAGVPYPAFFEVFIMEIFMEIMKEAGLRMPKPIGQAVSIVGTLVIGQAAVSAGLASPLLIMMVALVAISSFAIPSYTMSNSLRLLRFPLIFLTSIFGLLGYLAGVITIILHLMSLRSFGTPFLAPIIPFDASGSKDVFVRAPWWTMLKRPRFSRPKDSIRQGENQKPKP